MKFTLCLGVLFFLLTGCVSTINSQTAFNYLSMAGEAKRADDWFHARMYYSRAITNLELAGVEGLFLGEVWYEYGRASGVICDWEEAERGLTNALKIDREHGGPPHMALVEMAQISLVRNDFDQANMRFGQAYEEIERNQIDTTDPVGYADFLERYAYSLEQTNDEPEASELKLRAQKIREAFVGKESHSDITPYGTQCLDS